MTNAPEPEGLDLLPDLIDLDTLLRDVPPLRTPHDWAAPELFPDDGEFEEFLASVRTERNKGMA